MLAVGYKYIDTLPETLTSEGLEQGLTLLGLVGMIDPPREEVPPGGPDCLKAGIRPVMITGDHVVTAAAIARDLGIMHEGDKAVTGAELDADGRSGAGTPRWRISPGYRRLCPCIP